MVIYLVLFHSQIVPWNGLGYGVFVHPLSSSPSKNTLWWQSIANDGCAACFYASVLWLYIYIYKEHLIINCWSGRRGNWSWHVTHRAFVYMYVYVSYRHLTCGLEIISVAIPMASSCTIYLYNVLNSRFRLLPILHCTCGSQFVDRLSQVSVPFSAPSPRQNSSWPWGCWAKWHLLPVKGAWCVGKRYWLGFETLQLCNYQMPSRIILKTL